MFKNLNKSVARVFQIIFVVVSLIPFCSYAQDSSSDLSIDHLVGGYIPVKKKLYDVPNAKNILRASPQQSFPASYRSDKQPWAANIRVKNQGGSQLCWAFSTSTIAEYSYAKELYDATGNVVNIDEISPAHLGQFLYNRINDPLGNTQGDDNNITNGTHWAMLGGNSCFTMLHLATWSGLGLEVNTPFEETSSHIKKVGDNYVWEGDKIVYPSEFAYNSYLTQQESIIFKSNDKNLWKTFILAYGAIGIGMEVQQEYFNPDEINPDTGEKYQAGKSFFNYKTNNINENHAITVVGWDDNYAKENFTHLIEGMDDDEARALTTPKGNGAWIIQNSWGPDYHEGGFFYMSYESAEVTISDDDKIVYDMQSADTYRYNFQYDGSSASADTFDEKEDGSNQDYYTGAGTRAANVFTNTTGKPISLEGVGYVTYNNGLTYYDVSVYTTLSNPNDPTSGVLEGTFRISSENAGFKTGKLNKPITIKSNDTFSIVFSFPDKVRFGVDKDYNFYPVIYHSSTEPSQSFFSEANSDDWKDMDNYEACFRIKGFANETTYDITGEEVVLSQNEFVYDGTAKKPEIVSIGGVALKEYEDYVVTSSEAKNVGTYTLTIDGVGNYTGSTSATFKIIEGTNTLFVKGKTATIKQSKLKNKKATILRSKVLEVTNAQGKLSYQKVAGDEKITINHKNGNVTVRKGLNKGIYKIKVKVTASGNNNYKKKTQQLIFKVVVK